MVLSSEAVRRDCPSLAKSTHLTAAVWALKTVDSPFLARGELGGVRKWKNKGKTTKAVSSPHKKFSLYKAELSHTHTHTVPTHTSTHTHTYIHKHTCTYAHTNLTQMGSTDELSCHERLRPQGSQMERTLLTIWHPGTRELGLGKGEGRSQLTTGGIVDHPILALCI